MVGSDSVGGSSIDSESVVGSNSASSVGSAFGTLAGFESAHSATEECSRPATLQSTEGNFQHYARWLHNMYTAHEDTPSCSS